MLPVNELEPRIVASLRQGGRLLLSAPTGSGKSTQLPQMLLRNGLLERGDLVVLQPRRLAARMLARRVAQELGSALGQDVGYQVRFEKVASARTRIHFVTEGVLLRRMVGDPELRGVAALVFDEFHERHLYADITLARALDVQALRPELRIIVMSATLDLPRLEAYLAPCATVQSSGRVYPVDVAYLAATPRRPVRAAARGGPRPPAVWELAADAFARTRGAGDTLVFMPGAYEIRRTIQEIERRPESRGHVVLPLHGELSAAEQDAAVAPQARPRVIVSTNVAETSLTIDGVGVVIDSGLVRTLRHDPNRGINTLLVDRISRASADQRAGRAGRTGPGRCVRLWTEADHASRPERDTPEVKRLDLAEVVLLLAASGVGDVRAFRWIEPPDERALAHAESLLAALGAIRDARVTDVGREMLELPVHPRYARLLLAGRELGCLEEALLVTALAQGRDLLAAEPGDRERLVPRRPRSDFELLMRAHAYALEHRFDVEACRRVGVRAQSAREVGPLIEQLRRGLGRAGPPAPAPDEVSDALRKALLLVFSDRVARCDPDTGRCELVGGRRGSLSRQSVVRGHGLIVAAEVREIEGKELRTELGLVTPVEPAWLEELFPDQIHERTQVRLDAQSGRVLAEEQRVFRDLPVAARPVSPPPQQAAALLADEVIRGRIALVHWNDAVEQWLLRLALLARTCPELGLAELGEDDRRLLLEDLFHGATHVKAARNLPVLPALERWLSPQQQELLRKHAPERLELATGKAARVRYAAGTLPYVALRIQELYDVRAIPRIAMGRVSPLVHVLAPNQRPVQVTHDLESFWREHYPALKKQLARRYPKHEWR